MAKHVVVDGSNIATEGRAMPSLRQLNDAVLAYIQEHPDDLITVVVDATFGHRIDPAEVPEFDAAIENNELVSPPAGAIGRGDAFLLTIANKAGATILSNDSFQEFHGDYPWLFDDGRLIGGKPVPHVGWVFVPRAPVRGPVSRRAVRDKSKAPARAASRPSKLASQPMPAPKTPPPTSGRRRKSAEKPERVAAAPAAATAKSAEAPASSRHAAINELLPFLGFVERHPIGSTVDATVESYSSHGAYVAIDGVRAYVPLRYLGDPPPRRARDALALGTTAPFIVVSFNAPRRGIDLAAPGFQPPEVVVEPVKKAAKRTRKAAAVEVPEVEAQPVKKATKATRATKATKATKATRAAKAAKTAEPEPVKRTRKKAAATTAAEPAAPVEPAPVAPAPAKRTRKKAAATKAAPPAVDGAAVAGLEPAPAKKARAPRAKKAVAQVAAS